MLDQVTLRLKAFVYDTSAGRAYQFAEHTVNSGNSSLYLMVQLY